MIDGVKIKKLKRIMDERGYLQEILRNDEEYFQDFGQLYMTTTNPGVVKGWHYHKEQTDLVCCINGNIKIALYDAREDSETKGEVQEVFLGEDDPKLVKIPKGVYHGWKCIGSKPAFIINCPDEVYNYDNPDEVRENPHNNDIPYDWKRGREIDG